MKPEERAARGAGQSTRAVHAGAAKPVPGAPVVTPVVQSATFYMDAVPEGEVLYTRYGTNPNHLVLGRKLAELERAEAAIALGSGMAATSLTLLSFLGAGDHLVAASALYGGTTQLLTREFPRLGIETTFVELAGDWAGTIRRRTRALLVEVPSNPTLRVPDIRALGRLAREKGLPLLVDATFATPVNFRPLEHGADVVIHSATKYLGGHSDLTAGVVAGPKDVIEEVRHKLKSFGPVLDPHAVWLLERGIKTLVVRVARQNENGLALAGWLEAHPAVVAVHYPGLESHPEHAVARELFQGFGGMLSLVVRGGDEAALRVMSRFRLVCVAPSLGGVETLASMPRFTSHIGLSAAERHALGIADGFIRLSLGIEDAEDLRADLAQALDAEAA
ncbi:MAG: aminotransferase class I/II-fold pyridoxal phosphate-dependent enzyme [Gemmatimonadetes bacterium]|nr:aminotransferase class I/II-fold pyridoxal phosphate-dependent enzyme [Gemmatimonadota bacterium]